MLTVKSRCLLLPFFHIVWLIVHTPGGYSLSSTLSDGLRRSLLCLVYSQCIMSIGTMHTDFMIGQWRPLLMRVLTRIVFSTVREDRPSYVRETRTWENRVSWMHRRSTIVVLDVLLYYHYHYFWLSRSNREWFWFGKHLNRCGTPLCSYVMEATNYTHNGVLWFSGDAENTHFLCGSGILSDAFNLIISVLFPTPMTAHDAHVSIFTELKVTLPIRERAIHCFYTDVL